jgi:hypothetical protein
MGEAKRRGTFANRRKQAAENGVGWVEGATSSVDPEIFVYAWEVMTKAATLKMPVVNPSLTKFMDEDGTVFSLTSTPLNIAMTTVAKELRELGVANTQAYLCRLMHLPQVYEEIVNDPQHPLTGYLERLDEEHEGAEAIGVNKALIEAMATANFIIKGLFSDDGGDGFMGFDMPDLIERAIAARSRMDAAEKSPQTAPPRG